MRLLIHIDGGARGNPGESGFGVHVADPEGNAITGLFGYLGTQTNNVAEYAALIAALRYAVGAGAVSVLIRSDSELLVRQIQGRYRVKSAGLLPMFEAAKRLISRLPRVTLEHVPREKNKEADRLANQAMDSRAEDPPGVSAGLPLPGTGSAT